MKYAGLFRRLYALLVDAAILAPFSIFSFWATYSFSGAALAVIVPVSLVGPAYHIWFHAHSGQTIGKRVANIRVVAVSGERISWREAIRRSSIDVLLGIPVVTAMFLALTQLTPDELGLGLIDRQELLDVRGPAWAPYARYASNIWYWSELVSMLFNSKRRALHDYIAGTVVVHEAVAEVSSEGRALGSA